MNNQITPEHLDRFSPALKFILEVELDAGNDIAETSEGWPETESIMVFLKKPFLKVHVNTTLQFRELNDPHWWKSEFYDKKMKHTLACKYE
jgi:hypothetical protein